MVGTTRKTHVVIVTYCWSIDAHSDGLLATLRANPVTANKKRMIELHNPSALVDLNFTGSMSFKWQFDWETHSFEFKKGGT